MTTAANTVLIVDDTPTNVAMMAGLSAFGPDRFWPAFEARYGILNGTLILAGLICGWMSFAGAVSFVVQPGGAAASASMSASIAWVIE